MRENSITAKQARVVRLWEENPGWTMNRVAARAGVAWVTVRSALQRAGIDPRSRDHIRERRFAAIRVRNENIRDMARQGVSPGNIAKAVSISRQRVHRIVSGEGL